MASTFTEALAPGGLSGTSNVRPGAPGSKRLKAGQVVVEGRELQQLQNEIRLLRVSVAQQAHAIRMLQQERRPTGFASNAPGASPQDVPDEAGNRRAAQALADLQVRLGVAPGTGAEQAAELEQSSESVKTGWIRDGLLVGSAAFGLAWSRTRQALEQACDRGELFSLKIGNKRWYPASLMGLSAEDVKAVCLLLRGVDPVSQFIFWSARTARLPGRRSRRPCGPASERQS